MKKKLIILFTIIITYFLIIKMFHIYIPCIFHKITNLYCPGCGVTRMILAIIEGDFYKAFRYNMLLFIVFPIFVVLLTNYFYSTSKNKKPLIKKIPESVLLVFLFILLIFGIVRNIFPYLAPINM